MNRPPQPSEHDAAPTGWFVKSLRGRPLPLATIVGLCVLLQALIVVGALLLRDLRLR